MSEFKKAIEERMIANSVWFDGEPKEVLSRLIEYEVLISLDPQVSERAAKLKADAVREAAEVTSRFISDDGVWGGGHVACTVDELEEYAEKIGER